MFFVPKHSYSPALEHQFFAAIFPRSSHPDRVDFGSDVAARTGSRRWSVIRIMLSAVDTSFSVERCHGKTLSIEQIIGEAQRMESSLTTLGARSLVACNDA